MTETPDGKCNICGHSMNYVVAATVLGQYQVRYFTCPECEFFCTEKPYWLAQAYSQAIAATDTGIVLRNLKIARQLTCVLPELFTNTGCFLDVAGGTGLLTRLMRDNGFDFYWEDKYCQNILAFGFGAPTEVTRYDAVTAFEAIEHMEQPYDFVKSCVARSTTGTFIFSTELFDSPVPINNWWYLSTVTGQHISFFSKVTLRRIAHELQLNFMSHCGLHLLTRLNLHESVFRRLLDDEAEGLFDKIAGQRTGLTQQDHELMTRRALGITADVTHNARSVSDAADQASSYGVQPHYSGNSLGHKAMRARRLLRSKIKNLIT